MTAFCSLHLVPDVATYKFQYEGALENRFYLYNLFINLADNLEIIL